MSVPKVQVPSMYMAALPLAEDRGVRRVGLVDVTGSWRGHEVLDHLELLQAGKGLLASRSPYHLPPFSTAIWPPSAHTMGMAAYHSSPGR